MQNWQWSQRQGVLCLIGFFPLFKVVKKATARLWWWHNTGGCSTLPLLCSIAVVLSHCFSLHYVTFTGLITLHPQYSAIEYHHAYDHFPREYHNCIMIGHGGINAQCYHAHAMPTVLVQWYHPMPTVLVQWYHDHAMSTLLVHCNSSIMIMLSPQIGAVVPSCSEHWPLCNALSGRVILCTQCSKMKLSCCFYSNV